MSEVIHKYKIQNDSCDCYTDMPFSARIISVSYQRDDIQVWAIVESDDKDIHRVYFNVYPTGLTVEKIEGKFLGTVICSDGSLVFHVYLK